MYYIARNNAINYILIILSFCVTQYRVTRNWLAMFA